MPTINVAKSFKLNLRTITLEFKAGVQEVEEEIASHWYTLLHLVPQPEVEEPTAESEPVAVADEPHEQSEPVAADVSVTEEPDGSVHVDTPEEVDEKATLQAQAESLGIAIDRRWGVKKLREEIAAKSAG
ncbi:STY1053 family phage-associated protein [Azorhizobium caulinodans]|uniref:STY1053 family phage-associated protein n=1 Tax=Azorhizobium caulinodans TaxID=7 RepID=UPI002FBDD9F0